MKPEELARLTVEKYVKARKTPDLIKALDGVEILKAGTFVSIKTKSGELRGCIGTIFPTKNLISEEIISNAVAAATRDPRFDEIKRNELDNLKYSVDILFPPEKVASIEELDAKIYGIIIASESGRQALLLPDLEGVDSVEAQINVCMRKAGIMQNEPIAVQRFKVERYAESEL